MQVAIIGVGVMGEAILRSAIAHIGADNVVISVRRTERALELGSTYGVRLAQGNLDAVDGADVVILGVKPQDMLDVLSEISPNLSRKTLVVSLAAGLTTTQLATALPPATAVVRVMPNTPALIGKGMAAISGGRDATPEHLATVENLLAASGKVVQVPEAQQNVVTAISGSGPAYAFYMIDALIEAGVLGGLSRELAATLATQTVLGAASMVEQSNEGPVRLREKVSSPGGTTIAAIRELDERGVRAAFIAAAEASWSRAAELGK